jgi:hypothetical protein
MQRRMSDEKSCEAAGFIAVLEPIFGPSNPAVVKPEVAPPVRHRVDRGVQPRPAVISDELPVWVVRYLKADDDLVSVAAWAGQSGPLGRVSRTCQRQRMPVEVVGDVAKPRVVSNPVYPRRAEA